jgi:hypothetical protein
VAERVEKGGREGRKRERGEKGGSELGGEQYRVIKKNIWVRIQALPVQSLHSYQP